MVVIAIIGLLSSIVLVVSNLPAKKQKIRIATSLEFSQSVQSVLGSEAVAIWNFDEGLSGLPLSIAQDSSGNRNSGTCPGASCPVYDSDTPQKIIGQDSGKYALQFDGSDYVEGPAPNFTAWTEATIEAWINPSSIVSSQIAGSYYGGYSPSIDLNGDGKVLVHFGRPEGAPSIELTAMSTSVLTAGAWHHIVGVAKTGPDGYAKIYVDGALEATTPGNSLFTYNGTIIVGARSPGTYSFNGLIDEVRIYSSALSSSNIQKHYAEGLEKYQFYAKLQ